MTLIGPNWRFGADGTDRFADPKDWVLQELAHALEHKANGRPRILRHYCHDGLPRSSAEPDRPRHIQGLKLSGERTGRRTWIAWPPQLAKILGTNPSERTIQFPESERTEEARASSHRSRIRRPQARRGPASPNGYFHVCSSSTPPTARSRPPRSPAASLSLTSGVGSLSWHAAPNWPRPALITPIGQTSGIVSMCGYAPSMLSHSVTWYDIEMACDMHEVALQVASEDKIGWPLRPSL